MVLLVSAGFSCRSAKQLSFRGLTLVGVSGLTGPHVSYHQVSLDFFFFLWPHCGVCGILVPQPGMEPMPRK